MPNAWLWINDSETVCRWPALSQYAAAQIDPLFCVTI